MARSGGLVLPLQTKLGLDFGMGNNGYVESDIKQSRRYKMPGLRV